MYECPICLSLNSDARFHCQNCGTIPAKYSFMRVPVVEHDDRMTPIVVAVGAVHSCKHHVTRINLRTVELDYYAE